MSKKQRYVGDMGVTIIKVIKEFFFFLASISLAISLWLQEKIADFF